VPKVAGLTHADDDEPDDAADQHMILTGWSEAGERLCSALGCETADNSGADAEPRIGRGEEGVVLATRRGGSPSALASLIHASNIDRQRASHNLRKEDLDE
jgi:hypothetical protein